MMNAGSFSMEENGSSRSSVHDNGKNGIFLQCEPESSDESTELWTEYSYSGFLENETEVASIDLNKDADFEALLKKEISREFSKSELREKEAMAEHKRQKFLHKEGRSRCFEIASGQAKSYLELYPELSKKLSLAADLPARLKLLRGFFFWIQHCSMEGSFQPWLDPRELSSSQGDQDFQLIPCSRSRTLESKTRIIVISEQEDDAGAGGGTRARPVLASKPNLSANSLSETTEPCKALAMRQQSISCASRGLERQTHNSHGFLQQRSVYNSNGPNS